MKRASADTRKKAAASRIRVRRRDLLNAAAFLLIIYVVAPQIGYFRSSLQAIRHADGWFVATGAICTVATYLLAAALYQLLAKKRLHYGRTLGVQAAGAFVNRLLPAGLGGISLNVAYLRRAKHTFTEAATVVGTNNALGFIGHILLLAIVVAATDVTFQQLRVHISPLFYLLAAAVLAVAGGVLLLLPKRRSKILLVFVEVLRNFASYRQRPWRLLLALGVSMMLTGLYALVLWCCVQAIGDHVSLLKVFVIFTVGMFVGTATPTPGGLVGFEAAVVAGCIAAGTTSADALAITLTYRVLTYWLPIVPGVVAFRVAERRRFF